MIAGDLVNVGPLAQRPDRGRERGQGRGDDDQPDRPAQHKRRHDQDGKSARRQHDPEEVRPCRRHAEQAQERDLDAQIACTRSQGPDRRQQPEAQVHREQHEERVAARLAGEVEQARRAGQQRHHREATLEAHDARGIEQRRETGERRRQQTRRADRNLVRARDHMPPEIKQEVIERRIRLERPYPGRDLAQRVGRVREIERRELVDPEVLLPQRRGGYRQRDRQQRERHDGKEPDRHRGKAGCFRPIAGATLSGRW